jgi:hypothetical protein
MRSRVMLGSLVAVAVVAAVAVGGVDGRRGDRATTNAPTATASHSALTAARADSECPLSYALGAQLLPGRPNVEAGLGPGEGEPDALRRATRGPVYLVFSGVPRVVNPRRTGPDRKYGAGWRSFEALILSRATYRGTVAFRGGARNGKGALGFGRRRIPVDQLDLPIGRWSARRPALRRWGVAGSPSARWRAWPATFRVRGSGCFEVEITGDSFHYLIVFYVA